MSQIYTPLVLENQSLLEYLQRADVALIPLNCSYQIKRLMDFMMLKYLFCVCLVISIPSHSMLKKRKPEVLEIETNKGRKLKVRVSGDLYRANLQKAVAECMTNCETIEDVPYISKHGYYLTKEILLAISKPVCESQTLEQKYWEFTDFYSAIIRTIKPELYSETLLNESFDEVNEAFNTIKASRAKGKRRIRY